MGTVLDLDRFRTLEAAVDASVADEVTVTGAFKIPTVAGATTYADDAAAGVGGLVAGDVYAVTTSGLLAVKL